MWQSFTRCPLPPAGAGPVQLRVVAVQREAAVGAHRGLGVLEPVWAAQVVAGAHAVRHRPVLLLAVGPRARPAGRPGGPAAQHPGPDARLLCAQLPGGHPGHCRRRLGPHHALQVGSAGPTRGGRRVPRVGTGARLNKAGPGPLVENAWREFEAQECSHPAHPNFYPC